MPWSSWNRQWNSDRAVSRKRDGHRRRVTRCHLFVRTERIAGERVARVALVREVDRDRLARSTPHERRPEVEVVG